MTKRTALFLLVLIFLSAGGVASAQTLPPPPASIANGILPPCAHAATDTCTFNDFLILVNNIITFLIYYSAPLAILSIVYAGFLLVWAGATGNGGKVSKAKHLLWLIVLGYVLILGAFVIVKAVLQPFIKPEIWNEVNQTIQL